MDHSAGGSGPADPGDRPDSEARGSWRGIGKISLAVWAGTLLAFAGSVVAARMLGPSRWGQVMLAVGAASLVATFLDLTLEEAVVHHGARLLADGQLARLRGLLRTALVVDLLIGLVVSAVLLVFAGPLSELLGRGTLPPDFLRLAALAVLAGTVDGTTSATLLIARRPDLRAWSQLGGSAARLAAVAVAAQLGGPRAVLVSFVIAAGAASAVQGYLAWRVARRSWQAAAPEGGVREWFRRLLSFGLQTSLATSVIGVNRAVVTVVLARVSNPRTVGLFDAAMLPLSIAAVASSPIRLWLMPEQAWLWARGRVERLRTLLRTYTLVALGVGAAGAVVGWFILPWLLPALYSERFADAVPAARVALVAAIASLGTGWAKTLAGAVGRPEVRTILSSLQLVTALVLILVLADHGAFGAAIAESAAWVLGGILWICVLPRMLRPRSERTTVGMEET